MTDFLSHWPYVHAAWQRSALDTMDLAPGLLSQTRALVADQITMLGYMQDQLARKNAKTRPHAGI